MAARRAPLVLSSGRVGAVAVGGGRETGIDLAAHPPFLRFGGPSILARRRLGVLDD